jgi:hypothetical protein
MPKVVPELPQAAEQRITMAEPMQEQMPNLIPAAMENLMPNMLPLIISHLPCMEAYLRNGATNDR